MDKTKKKIWKKVMIYQVATWVIVVALVTFFYFRSGSITAALTVGLALFLASFRFTYSEYQQAKREERWPQGIRQCDKVDSRTLTKELHP